MTFFLGIDGGGTGCRAAVADPSGRVLGHGTAGPANIASDPETARRNILSAARAALAASATGADLTDLVAGLGLAGANASGAADALRHSLPFARSRIETDAVTATLGALGDADGIVAALGTGSVFTQRHHGAIRQFGGWGLVLGDEGSGGALGRAAMAEALRAFDGLAPMTPFLQQILAARGGPAGLVSFAARATPADFAALAPEILASEDPAARSLWQRAVGDVAQMIGHLRITAPLPVTFIGGLGPAYAQALPDVPQRPALGTALDGALRLARGAA
jgi:glucosamine kinase